MVYYPAAQRTGGSRRAAGAVPCAAGLRGGVAGDFPAREARHNARAGRERTPYQGSFHEARGAEERGAAAAAALPVIAGAVRSSGRSPPPDPQGWTWRVRCGEPWEDVPVPFRRLPAGRLEIPGSRAPRESGRSGIAGAVAERPGEIPPRPEQLRTRLLSRERRAGYGVEKLAIDNGVDSEIPASVVIPDTVRGRAPAVLLFHWHSGSKEGVLFSPEQAPKTQPAVCAAPGPVPAWMDGATTAAVAARKKNRTSSIRCSSADSCSWPWTVISTATGSGQLRRADGKPASSGSGTVSSN